MSAGGEHMRGGRLLGGRYRLAERIGSGGMGTVWRAYDELVERDVAVKQPRLPGDPEDEAHQRAAHRLHREARAAARVDHPSAVSIHDVVVEDGLPWIVMELVRGESLHDALRRGPLDPAECARIGLAVLGALRAAHAVGIVHRDVKPANVLLGPHRRVVLTDFGIAHVQGEESLTASGEFVGSLEFIAPERMSGGMVAGPASDLWSLGVLLYAAVDGSSPFRRTTVESTLAAVLSVDPPEPENAGPLAPLIGRLLEKDPDRRPGADEVAAVLETVAEGRPGPDAATVVEQPVPGTGPLHDTVPLPEESPGDTGTPRLGPARAEGEPAPDPAPAPLTRRPLLLAAPLAALLGVLLVGGLSYIAYYVGGTRADAANTKSGWVAHQEKELGAVLHLPSGFNLLGRAPSAGEGLPRSVTYTELAVDVTLSRWEKIPDSLMNQAEEDQAAARSHHPDARTTYTNTSFHGDKAVLADTTYGLKGDPTRVMQLIVGTDSGRMYELRVRMPKGTPAEKRGTAVFKGARDRLELAEK